MLRSPMRPDPLSFHSPQWCAGVRRIASALSPSKHRSRLLALCAWVIPALLLGALWHGGAALAATGCAFDFDCDGVSDSDDNCPNGYNPDQDDADYDGVGGLCDNCPDHYNPSQANADQHQTIPPDTEGNVCDATPGTNDVDVDGVLDAADNCPLIPNALQVDRDGDGTGDLCDVAIEVTRVYKYDQSASLEPADGRIVPAGYFDAAGAIRVKITAKVPLGTSAHEYTFSLSGSAWQPAATLVINPLTGDPVLASADPVTVTFPQPPAPFVTAEDALIPVIVSLRDKDLVVVATDSRTLVDGRDMTLEANARITDNPLTLQLAPSAFDKLEHTHVEPLPYPSIEALNAAMTDSIAGVDAEKSTSFAAPLCLPLNDIPLMKQTPEWGQAYAEAVAIFASYKATRQACDNGIGVCAAGIGAAIACGIACAAVEQSCVKEVPTPADFEVCFDSLDGTLTSQVVERLAEIDLRIADDRADTLYSDVIFDALVAKVDIRLADFEIRYTEGGALCLPGNPRQDVAADSIDAIPELADFLTCKDASVASDHVCSTCDPDYPAGGFQSRPEPFLVGISAEDPELVSIEDDGTTGLMLQGLSTSLPAGSVCTNDAIDASLEPTAQALLEEYFPVSLALIDDTWNGPLDGKAQADHVKDLLRPLDTGAGVTVGFDAELEFTNASLDGVDGLMLDQSIEVLADDPPPPPGQLYTNAVPGMAAFTGGTAPSGLPFDLAMTINTSYLNRLIAARARPLMDIALMPTYAELGIAPPAGTPGDAPVAMTGDGLAPWSPLFAELGGKAVTIESEVVVTPFTWMPLDWVDAQAPLYFDAPRIEIRVLDAAGRVLARMLMSRTGELDFSFSQLDQDTYLSHTLSGDWEALIINLDFDSCDMVDALNTAGANCGIRLAMDLRDLFASRFDAALEQIFGQIPAHQFYDQAGTSLIPYQSVSHAVQTPQAHVSMNGRYSLFGDLAPALVTDTDGDGVADIRDNCEAKSNPEQLDTDGDGSGDACDTNDDNDSLVDDIDLCPLTPSGLIQSDLDDDGLGDECDNDDDGDNVADLLDNCPTLSNPLQRDADADGLGDICDNDLDNDGIADPNDNCPDAANPAQTDLDDDGLGDVCDRDRDGDAVRNGPDNCPDLINPDQLDYDLDDTGNACDPDADNDLIFDAEDNCPDYPNTDQADADGDGVGDLCEDPSALDSDFDGVDDASDAFPTLSGASADTDGDGMPDSIDPSCDSACQQAQGLTEDTDDDNDGVPDAGDPDPLDPMNPIPPPALPSPGGWRSTIY